MSGAANALNELLALDESVSYLIGLHLPERVFRKYPVTVEHAAIGNHGDEAGIVGQRADRTPPEHGGVPSLLRVNRSKTGLLHTQRKGNLILKDSFPVFAFNFFNHAPGRLHRESAIFKAFTRFADWCKRQKVFNRFSKRLIVVNRSAIRLVWRIT